MKLNRLRTKNMQRKKKLQGFTLNVFRYLYQWEIYQMTSVLSDQSAFLKFSNTL